MSDLISREEIRNLILEEADEIVGGYDNPDSNIMVNALLDLIDSCSTINPDDLVKHGEWRWKTEIEPDEHYICFCSCCKKTCHIWYDKEDDMEYYIRSNYCPNCGAKMDGGKRENE